MQRGKDYVKKKKDHCLSNFDKEIGRNLLEGEYVTGKNGLSA